MTFEAIYSKADGVGRTQKVWLPIPAAVGESPCRGYFHPNDFLLPPIAEQYTETGAGTIAHTDGNMIDVDAGSGTAGNGSNIQWAGPHSHLQNDAAVAWESRQRLTGIGSGVQFFSGLAGSGTTDIISGGAVNANDCIGFFASGTTLTFVSRNAGGTTTVGIADLGTLTEGDWFKCGFNVTSPTDVTVVVDNQVYELEMDLDMPQVALLPSLVVQANGSQAIGRFDWTAVGTE